MINSSPAYRDETHTYRRIGKTITMIPIGGGTPCAMVYDSEALARDRLGWLVREGRMKKAPGSAGTPPRAGGSLRNHYSTKGGAMQ